MKKILNFCFVVFFFMFGVFLLPSHKANAAVTVSVTASPTSVASGGYSTITWTSSGATSCYRTDTGGSVALNNSSGFQVGPIYSTTTFGVRCTDGMVYYQLSPCNFANVAAEYYTSNGSWSTGTLVQGASGVYYRIAGSNENDNPSKWNVSGITMETNQALCK